MRFLSLFLFVFTAVFCFAEEPSQAQKELQSIILRQKKLLAEAAKDNPRFDESQFKTSVQELVFDYESYLKKHPEIAAGYAAYGFLLSKIDMRRQSIAMLMKANKMDPNQALVKNQIGNYLAEDGKPVEAANYYIAASKLEPTEPLYHYQLGTLLHEAQAEFLKSGEWSRASLDRTVLAAFKRASELAPDRIEFAYRYAEAYYDLETPAWDTALKLWNELEQNSKTGVDQEICRLHRANILLKTNKINEARELLASVSDSTLAKQKEKLIAQLPESTKK